MKTRHLKRVPQVLYDIDSSPHAHDLRQFTAQRAIRALEPQIMYVRTLHPSVQSAIYNYTLQPTVNEYLMTGDEHTPELRRVQRALDHAFSHVPPLRKELVLYRSITGTVNNPAHYAGYTSASLVPGRHGFTEPGKHASLLRIRCPIGTRVLPVLEWGLMPSSEEVLLHRGAEWFAPDAGYASSRCLRRHPDFDACFPLEYRYHGSSVQPRAYTSRTPVVAGVEVTFRPRSPGDRQAIQALVKELSPPHQRQWSSRESCVERGNEVVCDLESLKGSPYTGRNYFLRRELKRLGVPAGVNVQTVRWDTGSLYGSPTHAVSTFSVNDSPSLG